MFSKTVMSSLVVVILSSALTACGWTPFKSLRTGDKNPPPGSIQVDLSRYSCMSQLGKKVDDYFSGRMSESDVHLFGGCLRTALHRFSDMVVGTSSNDFYTPEDLQKFLNLLYLKDSPLTSAFASEIMKIKVITLGGSVSEITKVELNGLIDLITFVENEAIAQLPYIPMYRSDKSINLGHIERSKLENMRGQLRQSGQRLADRMRLRNIPYDLSSLHNLLTELYKFLKWDELRPGAKTPEQIFNLVVAHKAVVTGQDSQEIQPQDWVMILDSISSIYGIYVEYEIQVKELPLTYGEGLDSLISSVKEGLDLVSRIIDQSPQKLITFGSTNKLLDALNDLGLMPHGVRVASIKEVYQYLIQRAFRNPLNTTRNEVPSGLGAQELYQIKLEFDQWASAQQYLSDNAKRGLNLNLGASDGVIDAIAKAIESFDFRSFLENGVDGHDPRSREIERIVKSVPAFFKSGGERAYIMPRDQLASIGVIDGIFDLSRMNIFRALTRLLIRASATDDRIVLMNKDWEHTGVTEDEMNDFFNKIRNLGIDIKFMDPRKVAVGRRSFSEGKLFTFDGNGINAPDAAGTHLLNFTQSLELISTIWSGGHVRDMVYNDGVNACPDIENIASAIDVFGMTKINRSCFEHHFYDSRLSQFENLPGLKKDFDNRNRAEKRQIVASLAAIALSPCSESKYVELGEIATMATVLHYLEAIFTIYDRDRDGVLDNDEIMHAFRRFSGYLARQVHDVEHKDFSVAMLKSVYAYLVQNKRLPTAANAVTLYFNRVRYFNDDVDQFQVDDSEMPDSPKMSLDRLGMLQVLQVLAEENFKAQKEADPENKLCLARGL